MGGKAIIVSAPSGAGKTTLVKHLLEAVPALEFSVSACSRPRRENEVNGRDYYFITAEEFRRRIGANEFVEWEEVYPGSYYGTLKPELERIWKENKVPLFDVDVKGGINLKKYFGDSAMALFISAPSIEELENRLRNRKTDDEESIRERVEKASYENTFADRFDKIIMNHDLSEAHREALQEVNRFLGK